LRFGASVGFAFGFAFGFILNTKYVTAAHNELPPHIINLQFSAFS
jgi:hypothetical protein